MFSQKLLLSNFIVIVSHKLFQTMPWRSFNCERNHYYLTLFMVTFVDVVAGAAALSRLPCGKDIAWQNHSRNWSILRVMSILSRRKKTKKMKRNGKSIFKQSFLGTFCLLAVLPAFSSAQPGVSKAFIWFDSIPHIFPPAYSIFIMPSFKTATHKTHYAPYLYLCFLHTMHTLIAWLK